MKRKNYFYLDKKTNINDPPLKITKNGLDYMFIKRYPNFYSYYHEYTNSIGGFVENFDEHDLLVLERYGIC